MNDEFDNFRDVIDGMKVDRKRNAFKISQLKIEHFYWNLEDIDVGVPITTSIELTCKYNFEKDRLEWKKTISHTYLILEEDKEYTTDSYDEEIDKPDELLEEIQKYDLRDLKNNYFTEEEPEEFSHWELTYNNYFKIVGTYDEEISEFEKISELLNFKKVIAQEVEKVQKKFRNIK